MIYFFFFFLLCCFIDICNIVLHWALKLIRSRLNIDLEFEAIRLFQSRVFLISGLDVSLILGWKDKRRERLSLVHLVTQFHNHAPVLVISSSSQFFYWLSHGRNIQVQVHIFFFFLACCKFEMSLLTFEKWCVTLTRSRRNHSKYLVLHLGIEPIPVLHNFRAGPRGTGKQHLVVIISELFPVPGPETGYNSS